MKDVRALVVRTGQVGTNAQARHGVAWRAGPLASDVAADLPSRLASARDRSRDSAGYGDDPGAGVGSDLAGADTSRAGRRAAAAGRARPGRPGTGGAGPGSGRAGRPGSGGAGSGRTGPRLGGPGPGSGRASPRPSGPRPGSGRAVPGPGGPGPGSVSA